MLCVFVNIFFLYSYRTTRLIWRYHDLHKFYERNPHWWRRFSFVSPLLCSQSLFLSPLLLLLFCVFLHHWTFKFILYFNLTENVFIDFILNEFLFCDFLFFVQVLSAFCGLSNKKNILNSFIVESVAIDAIGIGNCDVTKIMYNTIGITVCQI